MIGQWHGESVQADGAQDESALGIMREVVRAERWKITKVTPTGMQRERVGLAGGRPVGEAMYVREDSSTRCIVELHAVGGGKRMLTLTPTRDGKLLSRTADGWFTAVYRQGR